MDISSFIKTVIQADLPRSFRMSDLEIIKTGEELRGRVTDIRNDGKVMVDLGKLKVAADIQFPVKKGDSLTVRVDELGNRIKMKVVNLEPGPSPRQGPVTPPVQTGPPANRTHFNAHIQGPAAELKSLKPGSVHQAQVLEPQKDGKTVMKIGNLNVSADLKFPVSRGELLQVKMTETGETFRMQLTGPESKLQLFSKGPSLQTTSLPAETAHALKTEISNILVKNDIFSKNEPMPQTVRSAFQAVQSFLEPLTPDVQADKMPPKLRMLVEDTGMMFEKKLEKAFAQLPKSSSELPVDRILELPEVKKIWHTDLKPNLFIIREFIQNQESALKYLDSRQLEAMKNMVERLIGNLDDQQSKAMRQQEPDQTLFFTHMLYLKDEGLKSRLRVYYSRKKSGDSKTGTRISLLLTLDKLGEVRSDLFLIDSGLSINFYVASLKTETMISENLQKIHGDLSSGFQPLNIKVTLSEERIREFDQEELVLDNDQTIDIRA